MDQVFYSNNQNQRRFHFLPLIIFAAIFIYYLSSNREAVPVTGRSHLIDMSQAEEAALGLSAYQEVLSESRVITSGRSAERVLSIGRRIAAISEDPGFEWEFNLIDSPEVNAFCLPGGKVAVYTGILPVAANDDGLAVIMGHEIAHAIARHGAERMAHQRLAQYGQIALGMSMRDYNYDTQRTVMGAFGLGAQYGVLLPFSRTHESEADHIGLIFAARACFDPNEAPRVWQRMADQAKTRPPEFLSTHPSNARRIQELAGLVPEAMSERAKYCNN